MNRTIHFLKREWLLTRNPPGFLPLATFHPRDVFDAPPVYGVVPDAGGGCEWRYSENRNSPLWETVPEHGEGPLMGRIEFQRHWLQFTRKELGWAAVLATTGKSQRTWEGWEQGRSLPYHHAYFLALRLWKWLSLPKNSAKAANW